MLIHCKFLWINQTPLDSSSSGIKAGHDRKKTRMLPCVLMFQCNMCTYVHTSGGFAICQLLEFACKLPRLEEEGKLLLVTHIGWEGALAEADSGKRWPAGFKLSTSSSLLLLSFRARPPTENKARKGSLWITFCLGTRCDSGKQTPPRSHACMVLASADAFRRGELFRCWQALRKPNRDSEELYGTRCPLAIKSSGGMHAEIEGVHACMHRLPVVWLMISPKADPLWKWTLSPKEREQWGWSGASTWVLGDCDERPLLDFHHRCGRV